MLGYLFYIGDRTKTDLPYLENTPGNHEWYQLRHQKAMNSEAVVRLAEASQDRYGFKDFKLKGRRVTWRAGNRHRSRVEETLPGCADYR